MSQKPGLLFYVPLYGISHHAKNDMHTLLDHLASTFHMSTDPCIQDLDDVDALHTDTERYKEKEGGDSSTGDSKDSKDDSKNDGPSKDKDKTKKHPHPDFLPAYLPVISTGECIS